MLGVLRMLRMYGLHLQQQASCPPPTNRWPPLSSSRQVPKYEVVSRLSGKASLSIGAYPSRIESLVCVGVVLPVNTVPKLAFLEFLAYNVFHGVVRLIISLWFLLWPPA